MVCCGCRRGQVRLSVDHTGPPTSIFPVTPRESTAFSSERSSTNNTGALDSPCSSGGSCPEAPPMGAAMHYPMYLMSWEVLMNMELMIEHQVLKRAGRLTVWSEDLLGRVLLVSHEWLGYMHPDPAGEQISALKGTLKRLASGRLSVQSDWKHQFWGKSNEHLQGSRLAAVLPICCFWLDYAGVPQVHAAEGALRTTSDHRYDHGDLTKDMMDAVRSIPAYVEHSAALLVLTPTCRHKDVPDRVCGFASWRGRGWCRVELYAALLSRTRVHLLRCIAAAAAPEFMSGFDAQFLQPGLGAYTCCARGHVVDGRAVECDKVRLSAVVNSMLEAAAAHLHEVGDNFRLRILLCSKERFLRGLPHAAIAAADASETQKLHDFQAWLRWDRTDTDLADAGKAPSLLHWAALAGNAPVIKVLLATSRRGIDSPTPFGASEFGLYPRLSPLHLAAFSADGQPDAMQALLDAGANAELRDGFHLGYCAPMYAVVFGTLAQIAGWFQHVPAWDLERRSRWLGCTLVAHAAFAGPEKAPFLTFLLERKANVRAGAGYTASADAALLMACLKDDSDPDLVALLLGAGCSPLATWDPPWRRWRAAYAAMRLAARWASLAGWSPGPLVTALANMVGSTSLHLAARNGNTAVMQLLLQAEADPGARNAMGRTPLELARLRFGGRAPDLVEAILPLGFAGSVRSALRSVEADGEVASEGGAKEPMGETPGAERSAEELTGEEFN